MAYTLFASFLCALFLLAGNSRADEGEVAFLLKYIAESNCVFVRNGSEYQGVEASSHLGMKYSHVKKRIQTTEDFIDKVATKSSMSGRQYQVRCNGSIQGTGRWLHDILNTHRTVLNNKVELDE